MTELEERFLARGKRVDNGEWVEGFVGEYYNGDKNVSCISIPNKETIGGSLCYDVSSKTLGRYTGVKDWYGKRVFEGDIVKLHYFYETSNPYTLGRVNAETEIICKIVWCELGWGYEDNKGRGDYIYERVEIPNEEIIVIGNIWDNPELLEE